MELLKQSSETREELGYLAVMEAIDGKREISQRELARETGLNLKKVNYCLHKLLEKGYIKFQKVRDNPDKRVYLYILTPSGLRMKSQLTYNFLKFTLGFYNQVEDRLSGTLLAMERAGAKRVILYGLSDVVRILQGVLVHSSIEIVGVWDSNATETEIHGLKVISCKPDGLSWDAILVTALEDVEGVQQAIRSEGIPQEKIWCLS